MFSFKSHEGWLKKVAHTLLCAVCMHLFGEQRNLKGPQKLFENAFAFHLYQIIFIPHCLTV